MASFIALALVLFLRLSTPSFSSSLSSDFHALVALKRGFAFSDPGLSSWNVSTLSSVCWWRGIQCAHGRVVGLDLTDMNLCGSVSPDISRLDQLSNISISGNNFTGPIEIQNLSSLRWLNISNNQFSGSLNWSFSTMEDLEVLDAYNNNFTALLPQGVLSLKKLRYLDLGGNFFYGKIPKIYGGLAALEYLSLAGNDLRGKIPIELGNLTSLKEIYLGYYNSFTDGIPSEFGKLINLVHMDLSSCELDGHIPEELGNLKSLNTLFLHINQLSGSIPNRLGNLTSLVNLDLSNNALTGEIPLELSNLLQLSLLNLFLNRLHGSIPDFVAELPNLQTLGLWMNNFTGIIPERLGQNGRLQELDLSSNKLTGAIPGNLCSSNQLRILILLKNFLFGPIPEGLGRCSSLTRVRLGQNYLNGSIPGGFIYLPLLNLMELQNNYISGTLPENHNSSFIPEKLGELNLSNNLLSGRLPSSLSNFTSLQILLLGGNQFSGPIPPSIGELKQVLKLDLSRNSLSGEIPLEIGACFHLTYLDISQNNLSGPIPSESIGSMKSLTIADFSFNELSGKLPESGQFAFFNASSYAGNPHLCGSLLNNPCNFTAINGTPGKPPADFKLIFALGIVYHGKMPTGAEVAVKKLLGFGPNSHDHGFRAEIQTLGNIRHRNIVRLIAFCSNKETNLLVYEYMKNGSLGEALHGKKGGFLGWNLRYKIAVDAAKGLCYLHHDCSPLIVHRDVKSNNILLNSSFEAHVADFGLAKFLIDGGASECMSAIAGSYGYIAPEYAYTLRVDEKSDVYSFGVVLLELITGRRPVGDFGEGVDIVQWAKRTTNCCKENVIRIVDPRLATIPRNEATHLFFIALLCIEENSVERPTMREVVQMLSESHRNSPDNKTSSSSIVL
ncbi:unnamed protein product, partial [Vitis vinifera]